jgi:hypothetical protein
MYERFLEFRDKVQFDAVVVTGSWHNLAYNRHDEVFWNEMFDAFCGKNHKTALCTLPAGIDEDACNRGIDYLIAGGAKGRAFAPWGSWPTSAEKTREVYEGLLRYNACVRRYCKAFGAILIDLFEVYRPSDPLELASGYFDPCHPRPHIYPLLADAARKALEPRLPVRPSSSRPIAKAFAAPAASGSTKGPHLPSTQVYPLW